MDMIPQIEDLTKGEIEFDMVTKIGGQLGLEKKIKKILIKL